jgi:3',5'-cyclic-AMP phosphodiesterase
MTTDPIQLVHLTDTHLYGTDRGALLKMNTRESFARVLELVEWNEEHPDYILVTGDVAQDASRAAYEQFLQQIASLDAPFRWIPGNHDSPDIMRATDTDACRKELHLNNWLILLLDTSVDGEIHGRLSASETDFLQDRLSAAAADKSVDYCLICLHHNPVDCTADWMKGLGLRGNREFFSLITSYPKVRCVVYGHIHQELDFNHQGIRCLCSPSTCIQFKPDVVEFTLDPLNPGYRSIKLYTDGRIDSRVHRLTALPESADLVSPGY